MRASAPVPHFLVAILAQGCSSEPYRSSFGQRRGTPPVTSPEGVSLLARSRHGAEQFKRQLLGHSFFRRRRFAKRSQLVRPHGQWRTDVIVNVIAMDGHDARGQPSAATNTVQHVAKSPAVAPFHPPRTRSPTTGSSQEARVPPSMQQIPLAASCNRSVPRVLSAHARLVVIISRTCIHTQ